MKNLLNAATHKIALGSLVAVSMLSSAQVVDAQPRWGRTQAPRAGACFYRDANFRGDYFCAAAGDDIASLGRGMNDKISSIRTFGDVTVTIFQDSGFRGRWTRLEGDVSNLRREGWNDRLSSVSVDYDRSPRDFDRRRTGAGIGRIETGVWRRPDSNDRRDSGNGRYDGRNDGRSDSRADGRNDGRLSSSEADAIVRRVYLDVLKREADAAGLSLYRDRMINENWKESDVRDAILKSPEYRDRNTMTQQKAQEIVARAYRSILKREPDSASQVYVNKVMHERWTEEDVSRELRNSPEYRSKNR